ncbi:hypothetical protein BpHYR1_052149 [Brachionus plicatilis]|uniref:Uncharacterized protein n=1 Tax=Brachionus plicatilis TaxID=10195 RepID=A0A3M7R511_BRAPC|nr:hypothetical protein BpHYR1_052149 [Brachionus plicatilis]
MVDWRDSCGVGGSDLSAADAPFLYTASRSTDLASRDSIRMLFGAGKTYLDSILDWCADWPSRLSYVSTFELSSPTGAHLNSNSSIDSGSFYYSAEHSKCPLAYVGNELKQRKITIVDLTRGFLLFLK